MTLNIITPRGAKPGIEVSRVFFPGADGSFEVLRGHAPLVAALAGGTIRWDDFGGKGGEDSAGSLCVEGGFVRVKDDVIEAIVE